MVLASDKKVHVNLSVPSNIDQFIEGLRYKNIVIEGKTITIKKDKSSIYLVLIEYGLENFDKIFKSREE